MHRCGAPEHQTGNMGDQLRERAKRNVKKVDNNMGDEDEVFRRRDSIVRTPPQNIGRACSLPEVRMDTGTQEEVIVVDDAERHGPSTTKYMEKGKGATTAKRQRENSDETSSDRLEKMVSNLTMAMTDLVVLMKGYETNPGVRAGLDRLVTSVVDVKDNLQKEIEERGKMKRRATRTSTSSMGTQTCPLLTDVGIQVEVADVELESKRMQTQLKDVITEVIERDSGVEAAMKIINKQWPEEVYSNTSYEYGGPWTLERSWDLALIADPKDSKETGVLSSLHKLRPEMVELLRECQDEEIEHVVRSFQSSRRGFGNQETYEYVVPLESKSEGANVTRRMYRQLSRLIQRLREQGRQRIAVVSTEGISAEIIRKIAEVLLARGDIQAKILTTKVMATGRTATKGVVSSEGRRTETLVVRASQSSYADLLKTIRKNVDVQGLGVKVAAVRKTGGGDLLMKIEGDKEKAGILKEEINKKIENVVNIRKRETAFFVQDIEADIGVQEIRDEIAKETGIPAEDVQVGTPRSNRVGNQTVTVIVREDVAWRLRRVARIQLGWISCRVKERVAIDRCYRCWTVGHKAAECSGPDRSKLCYRCGEAGHVGRNCEGSPHCPLCEMRGHMSGTTSCPAFRTALKEKETGGGAGRHVDALARAKGACWSCGEQGHLAMSCRKAGYCYVCQKAGHSMNGTSCPVIMKHVEEAISRPSSGEAGPGPGTCSPK